MIDSKQLLKFVDQSAMLLSILAAQLAKMQKELQVIVATGQAMSNLDALENSVLSMVSRCGTAAEMRQIFLDWKLATGLVAETPETDTRGRLPRHEVTTPTRASDCVILAGPRECLTKMANGNGKTNGHRVEGIDGNQDWLRVL